MMVGQTRFRVVDPGTVARDHVTHYNWRGDRMRYADALGRLCSCKVAQECWDGGQLSIPPHSLAYCEQKRWCTRPCLTLDPSQCLPVMNPRTPRRPLRNHRLRRAQLGRQDASGSTRSTRAWRISTRYGCYTLRYMYVRNGWCV